MDRRLFYRTAIGAVSASAVGIGGWWLWDKSDRMGLSVNCQSDNLSTVAKHLREYAEGHNGFLPAATELLTVAQGEHESYLWCNKTGLPYQWNLQLAGAEVAGSGARAVAWCPPGGHGRYVGVITVSGGEIHVEGITLSQLRQMVGMKQN